MKLRISYLLLFILVISCKKFEKESFIKTGDVSIDYSLYKAAGSIVDVGENGVDDYGHCWSTNTEPTVADYKTSFGASSETGNFESRLSHLIPTTTFYYRTYLEDKGEIKYGETRTFTTGNVYVELMNGAVEIQNASTVQVSGGLSNFESFSIVGFGHCISTSEYPDTSNERTIFGVTETDTNYVSTFENLVPGVTYYVNAYAVFEYDNTTIYSSDSTFVIADLVVNSITHTIPLLNYAQLEGEIVTLGYNPVTEHGFCWSISTASPDYNSTRIELGAATATGSFFGTIANMQGGVTYYWRAYAVANGIVKYGTIKTIVN